MLIDEPNWFERLINKPTKILRLGIENLVIEGTIFDSLGRARLLKVS